jgi:small-conductance mechanosensitive channel
MGQIIIWLDQHHISLGAILATVSVVIGASLVIFQLNRFLGHFLIGLHAQLHLPYEAITFAARVITSALWIITALLVLNIWGVELAGLWILLVSVATVIGVGFLATWTMVSNFTASFFLALWRPFHLGQIVEVVPENLKGRVIDRNVMFTTQREDDGKILEIPNNLFFQKMFRVMDDRMQFPFDLQERKENVSSASRTESPRETDEAAARVTKASKAK